MTASDGPGPPPGNGRADATQPGRTPASRSPQATGWYAYAVIARTAAEAWLPRDGIDGQPLQAVSHGDIAAVVSEIDLEQFSEESLTRNLEDGAWLESRVLAHESVLESLLQRHALLPMRFGTIFHNLDDVRETLRAHADRFSFTLRRIWGRKEWGVRGLGDIPTMDRWIEETTESLSPAPEPGRGGEGAAYLQARSDDRALASARRSLTARAEKSAELALRQVADQVRRQPGRDQVLIDLALLVRADREASLRSAVDELNDRMAPRGFRFELTGPWPPYNFVSLELEEEMRP